MFNTFPEDLDGVEEVIHECRAQAEKKLHQALPSLRTVQHIVHAKYEDMNEGEFCFDGLVAHIAQHNAVNVVSIGEDGTRIICRVEYDIRTNRCVGFVLPLKNGLPEVD